MVDLFLKMSLRKRFLALCVCPLATLRLRIRSEQKAHGGCKGNSEPTPCAGAPFPGAQTVASVRRASPVSYLPCPSQIPREAWAESGFRRAWRWWGDGLTADFQGWAFRAVSSSPSPQARPWCLHPEPGDRP